MSRRIEPSLAPEVYSRFGIALFDAVSAAEVGFHFEEGGCWAMAQALSQHFGALGKRVLLRYQPTYFVHAWAEVDGVAFDGSGVMNSSSSLVQGALPADVAELSAMAIRHGCDENQFESDAQLARELIEHAWRAVAEPPQHTFLTEVSV
ncbi:hypothetical protein [Burkholderia cenocepacia]|uniref:hypothetical protein n=1 Tax=Burkholderia cenocepacia TaxID=95486 RepID=UPI000761399C|nr:hypothetical protein [Burkholderia cenocepacia]KWU23429.1 hypothetical protein AS149_37200 [Burkholderia cenocepacia]